MTTRTHTRSLATSALIRLLPRRELELKLIKADVLYAELVGGWGGGGEPERRRFIRAS